MIISRFLVAATVVCVAPCAFGSAPVFAAQDSNKTAGNHAAAPEAQQLLNSVLEPPKTAYRGHMTVTHWFGRNAHSEEVRVLFDLPNSYRWEFLDPDGATPSRIVRSNGEKEEVEDARTHKRYVGEPVRTYQRLMGEEKERDLLLQNYDLTTDGIGIMAGRPCWILQITPKAQGKHSQRVWIDQQTGVVLQTRRYRPKGIFTTLSRFVSFEPVKDLPDELFAIDPSSAVEHGLDPVAMTLDDFKKEYDQGYEPPAELPGGFVFESANHFNARDRRAHAREIWHLRYTDGLATLSLFLTRTPVQRPRGQVLGGETQVVAGVGLPVMTSFAKVLQWQHGKRYYTLMGDVDRKWLETIAAKIP